MKKYCRFCAVAQELVNLINIFDSKYIDGSLLRSPAEIASSIFQDIMILESDEISCYCCQMCLVLLLNCSKFYNSMRSNQNKLKQIAIQNKFASVSGKILRTILPKENDVKDNKNDFQQPTSNKRTYDCFECDEKFNSMRRLKKHHVETHFTRNLCQHCNFWFTDHNLLDMHSLTHHKELKYYCFKCKDTFSTQRKLFKHLTNIHNAQYFYCSKCDKEFQGRQKLKDHIKKIHIQIKEVDNKITSSNLTDNISNHDMLEESMDVEFLDDFFLNQDENSFHFNECWDNLSLNFEDELKLKICDFSNDSFPQHQLEFQYKCPRCFQGFNMQIEMIVHLAHIHNENVFVCNECGENFNKLDEFKIHKHLHRKRFLVEASEPKIDIITTNSKTYYKCNVCKKKYKEKSSLWTHFCKNKSQDISNPVSIQCNLCTETFPSLRKMFLHQRQEHFSKPLKCWFCDKTYKDQNSFKYHLKSHEGVKSFICPFCNRKFLTNINLNAHIKAMHSIVKNHLCTLCDRRFATLDHLKKHVMSVHQKERSHLCSECGKLFSQVCHLKSHYKIHNVKSNAK